MVVNNGKTCTRHVKFISYTGAWPNLCKGTLTLEIDGVEYCFDGFTSRFWRTGGAAYFSGKNYRDSTITKTPWIIDASKLPENLRQYAEEIDAVFNENVEHGCCGGCL